MGTLPYMAPEQVEGKESDARSDIFSFGAVVYEMVTGHRAFSGDSQVRLISAILEGNPPEPSHLQPKAPRGLDRVIATCLAKHADDRWQTAADLTRELRWVVDDQQTNQTPTVADGMWVRRLAGAAAMMILIVAATAVWFMSQTTANVPPSVTRLAIPLPSGQQLALFRGAAPIALSPDGLYLAYVAQSGDSDQLYLRHVGEFESRVVPGTEGGAAPVLLA